MWVSRQETGGVRQETWDMSETWNRIQETGDMIQKTWYKRHHRRDMIQETGSILSAINHKTFWHTHTFSNRNVCDRLQTCQWQITEHCDTASKEKLLFKQCRHCDKPYKRCTQIRQKRQTSYATNVITDKRHNATNIITDKCHNATNVISNKRHKATNVINVIKHHNFYFC